MIYYWFITRVLALVLYKRVLLKIIDKMDVKFAFVMAVADKNSGFNNYSSKRKIP